MAGNVAHTHTHTGETRKSCTVWTGKFKGTMPK